MSGSARLVILTQQGPSLLLILTTKAVKGCCQLPRRRKPARDMQRYDMQQHAMQQTEYCCVVRDFALHCILRTWSRWDAMIGSRSLG